LTKPVQIGEQDMGSGKERVKREEKEAIVHVNYMIF
jgi:hypothetical protein